MTHGNQINISNTAVVAVRPTPRLITGRLLPADAQAVFEWARLNTDTLVAYWNGQIGTIQMVQALKPLPLPVKVNRAAAIAIGDSTLNQYVVILGVNRIAAVSAEPPAAASVRANPATGSRADPVCGAST